ncbi:hypothetical protein H7Q97_15580 [Ochrobactrum sp. CM-21-5]|nr:hypothetical protein [Ochrobactrum sp. CM-21-5]MBC2886807.1 hypothetical protein [Ochrobactrum sp. CM-21-5]
MKQPASLLSLAIFSGIVLSGCGAGKAAMDAGKGFDRFACMSRNLKGESPCPQPDAAAQNVQ